jgi:hypothetical protein
VIPPSKPNDSLHVAYATVHELDFLLSWNFQHLANVRREARILAINLKEGYRYEPFWQKGSNYSLDMLWALR